jgi:uncharacterized protein involved in exopolysaccharide biosynthesis
MNDNKIQIIKDDEIDLRALFQVLWNDRKRIIQITAVVTLMGVLYALLATPLYKSTITMYPSGQESGGQLGQLQGMASTFGFDVGGGDPSFHIPDIVQSRRIKTELIYHKWNSNEFDRPVNLIQYWEIDDATGFSLNPLNWIKALFASDEGSDYRTLKWESDALEVLNDRISVNEGKSGLITVEILMEEPEIAAEMANTMYPAIVEFTVETHSKQAKLNREFIERRQIEVKNQLTRSEDVLKVFRERNRSIMESPQLQLEMERHMREVEIQTQIYITLQQEYELARIDEVKETPSVVILDEGKSSIEKDTPKRKLIIIISIFFGGGLALTISLLWNTMNGQIIS